MFSLANIRALGGDWMGSGYVMRKCMSNHIRAKAIAKVKDSGDTKQGKSPFKKRKRRVNGK
jgi:hypothetical protein